MTCPVHGRFIKPVLLMLAGLALSCLAGCEGPPDRQNPLAVSSSTRSAFLPEADSIHARYRPVRPDGTPDSASSVFVPPTLSYEDRPLSDNLSAAIELADYAAAVRRAGYWPYLEGENSYTVLAIPNGAFEAYRREQDSGLMEEQGHDHLARLIGRTILKGRWTIAKIRRRAAREGGDVRVRTLAGPGHDLLFRPAGNGTVQVVGPEGTALLRNEGYPQANGILFVIDSVIPQH